jgi:hypothetical protein
MPGLVPGIHVFLAPSQQKDVDGRDIRAKTRFALLPGMTQTLCTIAGKRVDRNNFQA